CDTENRLAAPERSAAAAFQQTSPLDAKCHDRPADNWSEYQSIRRHLALNAVCERLVEDTAVWRDRQVIAEARAQLFSGARGHARDYLALRPNRHNVRVPIVIEVGIDGLNMDHLRPDGLKPSILPEALQGVALRSRGVGRAPGHQSHRFHR